jgi:pyruvate kinase
MAVINAARAAKKYKFANIDEQIIVTAGVPFNQPGSTNIIRVSPVNEKLIFGSDEE